MNIYKHGDFSFPIISYQAITGNNNIKIDGYAFDGIISYQAITGNNNMVQVNQYGVLIISYQAITGNNNSISTSSILNGLYHTKR